MKSAPFNADYLRSVLKYDPVTGIFVWLSGRRKGRTAGHLRKDGRVNILIGRRPYGAHTMAWLYMTGEWPSRIDHKDLVPSNNAFNNLRVATVRQNAANCRGRGAFMKGTTLHRKTGKFQAQVKADGKTYYLGLFATEIEANAAYAGAAKVLFGEFARSA